MCVSKRAVNGEAILRVSVSVRVFVRNKIEAKFGEQRYTNEKNIKTIQNINS